MTEEITILAFGQISEIIGSTAWKMAGVKSTEELYEKLLLEFPALKEITLTLAVNKKIIHENTDLFSNDTVALLPPFSGG